MENNTLKSTRHGITRAFGILAFAFIGAINASAELTPGKIEIGEVRGQASSTTGKETTILKKGTVVAAGSKIVTQGNSTAELYFANGARVLVQNDTELTVVTFDIEKNSKVAESGFRKLAAEPSHSKTILDVPVGRIVVEVQKLRAPISEFKVKTPFATVEVKGTAFTVEQAAHYVKIGNVDGSVAVAPLPRLGNAVMLSAKETVIYNDPAVAGKPNGAIAPMSRAEFIADVNLLAMGNLTYESTAGFEYVGPGRTPDDFYLVDATLVSPLSPNGEGEQP